LRNKKRKKYRDFPLEGHAGRGWSASLKGMRRQKTKGKTARCFRVAKAGPPKKRKKGVAPQKEGTEGGDGNGIDNREEVGAPPSP